LKQKVPKIGADRNSSFKGTRTAGKKSLISLREFLECKMIKKQKAIVFGEILTN